MSKSNLLDNGVLILHIPEVIAENEGHLQYNIMKMPMGILSIAGELQKLDIDVEIINYGVERFFDNNFDIAKYVHQKHCKLLLVPLHWHRQTKDTLRIVEEIKKANPSIFVVLGGFTASAFAKEIMEQYCFVDGVVKGEGEYPCVCIAQKIIFENVRIFDNLPNFFWRNENGYIIDNQVIWCASDEELSNFDYIGPLKKINHLEFYLKVPIELLVKDRQLILVPSQFIYPLGRGCYGNCSWCGGCYRAQKALMHRRKVGLRSVHTVVQDIEDLYYSYGISRLYTCIDPLPNQQKHIIEIFNLLGEKLLGKITWVYECFGLPSDAFLQSFKDNLTSDSTIVLSPDIANERDRFTHKTFSYTDAELLQCVEKLAKLQIRTEIYFNYLSETDYSENQARTILCKKIKDVKDDVYIMTQPIKYVEPYSPWWDSEQFPLQAYM